MLPQSEKSNNLSIFEYVTRRRTPVRELQDRSVATHLPKLKGKVIELGGLGEGRRSHALGASEYLVTNFIDGTPEYLNASAMDLPDNSVDGFICESMLEHVTKPDEVVSEVRRVLRPGGTLLLITPWMYPFHAAPSDYLRFSAPALTLLLEGFRLTHVEPLGNFWTSVATFAQLKVRPWKPMKARETVSRLFAGSPLLGFGLGCYALSRVLREPDDFAAMYLVLADKLGA